MTNGCPPHLEASTSKFLLISSTLQNFPAREAFNNFMVQKNLFSASEKLQTKIQNLPFLNFYSLEETFYGKREEKNFNNSEIFEQ